MIDVDRILEITKELRDACEALEFSEPVAFTYNPLVYAWDRHRDYWERFRGRNPRFLWLGMNPGPFGMAQTGVPFGDIEMARDFVGVSGPVGKPPVEHPKRPVEGFELGRSEVSGTRLWGWARDRFETSDAFFEKVVVLNYCPLLFVHESGRNVIPEKVAKDERAALLKVCDESLVKMVGCLQPEVAFGIGKFAEKRLNKVVGDKVETITSILHPSPASPKANKGWVGFIEPVLREHGVID